MFNPGKSTIRMIITMMKITTAAVRMREEIPYFLVFRYVLDLDEG